MSWSAETPVICYEQDIADGYIDGLLQIVRATIQVTPAMKAQIIAAQEAAKRLVAEMQAPGTHIKVSINGHSAEQSPLYMSEEWTVRDVISVNVAQLIDCRDAIVEQPDQSELQSARNRAAYVTEGAAHFLSCKTCADDGYQACEVGELYATRLGLVASE
jgi:hypothetical protein